MIIIVIVEIPLHDPDPGPENHSDHEYDHEQDIQPLERRGIVVLLEMAEQEHKQERGDKRAPGAEGDVTEDVEGGELRGENRTAGGALFTILFPIQRIERGK